MQTARLAKRPLIHTDDVVEPPVAAKRPLTDKAVIAADKENSQVTRKITVKKAAATAVLAPRAATAAVAKPAAPARPALQDISAKAPVAKEAAPPTRSLTLVASKSVAKPKAAAASIKPSAPSVLNLSFQEADAEPMLIDHKPQLPPGVEDIDALSNDPLTVPEYAADIYDYYFTKEKEVHPSPHYLPSHPELTAEMRAMLVDWLVDVHQRLAKTGDVLFLNVYLIDRFLTLLAQQRPARMIKRNHFQLLGIVCLFIASKIEEVAAICVADLCFLCDNKFTREEITKLESIVLSTLGFNLTVPTAIQFLRRFTRAGGLEPEVHMLTRYLLDSSLAEYAMLQYLPSLVAASALYLAKRLTDPENDDVWTPTLAYYTKYEEADLLPCATALNEMLKRRPRGEPKSLPSVQRKYLSKKCYQVANVQPLDEL